MKITAALIGATAFVVFLVPEAVSAREPCNVLLGGNENPPVASDGSGRFRVNIRPSGDLAYRLRYDFPDPETEVLAAHLHVANQATMAESRPSSARTAAARHRRRPAA